MPDTRIAWNSVKRIVADVIDAAPEARAALITERTGGDGPLREEVESLIRAAQRAEGLLSPKLDAWVGANGADLTGLCGQRIGRYMLDRLIAEGSSAAVYEATQLTPRRKVAVKLLRDALPLIDASRRFDREAAALGRINHPNVARIFEAGRHRTDSGSVLPYLAMEFVDGPTVTRFAQQQRLERDEIIRLAIKIATAVHAAHQQAIIHRDLKPANVLVGPDNEPKVLDFGIARLADGDARTWRTTAGVLLGTPGYMSPEQAAGRLDEIDVRTDVWACGVLLYELLTGRLPIDVTGVPLMEAVRRLEREEPIPLARVAPQHAGDLDVIVMTALAREKAARYDSAAALADDLERLLRNEPVAARPPSTLYRVQKFARRNRTGLIVTSLFVAMMLGGTILLAASYVAARRERDRAASERDRAQAVSALLRGLVDAGDTNHGDRNIKMVDALRAAETRITATVGMRPDVEADVRSALGGMYFSLGEYDRSHANFTRAIELRRGLGTDEDARLLADRNSLATTLRWQGNSAEARSLATQTLAIADRVLGPAHLVTLSAREILAACDHDDQNLVAAETGYRRTLAACVAHLGEEHPQTMITLANLAGVLGDMGQYAEALVMTERILAVHRNRGTLHTLEGLTARKNRATLMLEAGRSQMALQELEQVATEATTALGPGHDSTLRFLGDWAESLRRGGDTERALTIARDILDRRVATLGWSHEYTLNDNLTYASALLRARQFDKARTVAERGADESQRSLGVEHVLTHRHRLNIAAALSGLGRHNEARAIYDDTVPKLRATLGDDHQFTLVAINNLGLCCIEAGDGPAAVAALEPALDRVISLQFVSIEPVIRRNLGSAYRLSKRFDEAETQLTKAWDLSSARGETENALKTAAALADLFRDMQQPDRATEWTRRAQAATASRPADAAGTSPAGARPPE